MAEDPPKLTLADIGYDPEGHHKTLMQTCRWNDGGRVHSEPPDDFPALRDLLRSVLTDAGMVPVIEQARRIWAHGWEDGYHY